MALRFKGFGYEELLRMPITELEWWYDTAVALAEKEEDEMKAAASKGRRG